MPLALATIHHPERHLLEVEWSRWTHTLEVRIGANELAGGEAASELGATLLLPAESP